MEYHRDRFCDHSLLLYGDKGTLCAVLPAHETEMGLWSHGGLTYGGLVTDFLMTTPLMLEVFEALIEYLKSNHLDFLRYKTVPYIYHRAPAEEDRYALFRLGARLYRRDVLTVLANAMSNAPTQERRRRGVTKAQKMGVKMRTAREFHRFWPILEQNLKASHGAMPTHSLQEISLLHQRFPENITLHVCEEHDQIVGGVVMYRSSPVAHVQYVAASPRGREIGALDLLFFDLIEQERTRFSYFDFGISNERDGQILNVGLINFKEGFGGRAIVHDHYDLRVS
jgi:hypothetical protein